MRPLIRLIVALPLLAAMALPASAAWDFNFTASFGGGVRITDTVSGERVRIGGDYGISGRATADQDGVYRVAPSDLVLSGPVALRLHDEPFRLGAGDASFGSNVFSNTGLTFSFTQAGSVDWPEGPGNALAFSGDFDGTTVYFLAVKYGASPRYSNRLRATTFLGPDGYVDFRTTNAVPGSNRRIADLFGEASPVDVVPEINGSGLAALVFILGALGLWVHAGGITGRRQAATV